MKRKISYLIMTLLLAFMTLPVYAVSQNGFYADDNVDLKKEIGATTFAAGNMINVASNIDGMAFIAGNSVTISSTQDHLFAAGNTVTLNGAKAKDAFVAGSNVVISESTFRDLFAAAGQITLNSEITRNAYLGGDKVTINSVIHGNVKVSCDQLIFGENAKIEGNLEYPRLAIDSIPEGVVTGEVKPYNVDVTVEPEGVSKTALFSRFVYKLCSIILIGLLLLLIYKKLFVHLDKEEKSAANFFKMLGIGFGVLCLVPIASLILLFTVIGVPLGIITLLIWGILFYLSAIPTSYYLGKWILKDKIPNEYLLYMVSIAVLYVLFKIPVIGGLLCFVSLCVGLGFFSNFILSNLKETNEEKPKKR